ncbi:MULTISPECIES: hypothetical protein [unclassified Microcoleus]|uniref:hypothetical protein n=1 Tax=unclassified Microcoleus TaxID=2642155 RepID=UPI002FD09AE5
MTVFICCFCIVTVMVLFSWSVAVALREGVHQIRRLHQIPCSDCEFFTNDYRLKCTVRPCVACTEDAIGCTDFEPKTCFANSCQQHCSRLHKPYREIPTTNPLVTPLATGTSAYSPQL